jgi:CelD/BcsL family acetyltransferase involved in cellulose biosynthesis
LPPCSASDVALPFRVGVRTLARVRRRLARVTIGLAEILSTRLPNLPPIGAGSDGYLITGLAQPRLACLADAYPDLRLFVRRHYDRAYARLDGGADAYLARFSGKTRSTLRRKTRRLAERCGGALDLRRYAAPGEMEAFHCHARAVSVLTYQERLLDLGMPDGDSAVAQLKARAQRNEVRGWVLFVRDRPIAYLHAPAEGDVLILGHLGYDPAFAAMSPGTVLMFEAMRQLAAEGRYRLFDFTEGEGQHKRLFGTDAVPCVDVLLLRPTFANRCLGHALGGFDAAVEAVKRAMAMLGLETVARRLRR